MLAYVDFAGLGEKKKKEEKPLKPVEPPAPPVKSSVLIPKWSPIAAAALGIGVVVLILLTSKGKD